MWIPDNDPDAKTYLREELGSAFRKQESKINVYLAHAPRMAEYFRNLKHNAALQFDRDINTPDFHESKGAREGGRMLRASAFDGRKLGREIHRLRRPLPEFTAFGVAIESGAELNHFLNALRSWASLSYVCRRVICNLWDVLIHGRGMRLVNGNALVARLLAAAQAIERQPALSKVQAQPPMFKHIRIFARCPVRELIVEGGTVRGAVVVTSAGERPVHARHGVVLACGGFPHDVQRIRELVAHAPTGREHRSAAPLANTGDGLRLGESAGGCVRPTQASPAAWAPVSLLRRRDGSTATYPHFVERAKPGVIAVNRAGHRFCDEAASYFDVVKKWIETSSSDGPLEAWLICDRSFFWRYGLGVSQAFPLPWWAWKTGYLKMARTLQGLAKACGIDSQALLKTVDAYNEAALKSADPLGRGSKPFDRSQGDPTVQPNPCLAPILKAPFFAVRLQPGSLGTLAGLDTDEQARVLNAGGRPIAGLYACGNDMAAVMGGFYPSNGVTLGAAMTYGHLIGLAAAEKAKVSANGTD